MNGARAARRSLAGGLRPVTVYPQPARLHTKTPLPEDACPTEGFPNPDIVLLKWTLQAHCRRIGSEANGPRDSWRAWRPASSPESSARLGCGGKRTRRTPRVERAQSCFHRAPGTFRVYAFLRTADDRGTLAALGGRRYSRCDIRLADSSAHAAAAGHQRRIVVFVRVLLFDLGMARLAPRADRVAQRVAIGVGRCSPDCRNDAGTLPGHRARIAASSRPATGGDRISAGGIAAGGRIRASRTAAG